MTDERQLAYPTCGMALLAIAALSWPLAVALALAIGLPRMWCYGRRCSHRRGNLMVAATVLAIGWFSIAGVRNADAAMPVKLSAEARHLAAHGGIVCQTPGVGRDCATPTMRRLARELVTARFVPAGPEAVRIALCIVGRESGFNPGAISTTGDHGLMQANYVAHREQVDWSRIYDPVYALSLMWTWSRGGTNWNPWAGGRYPCW